MKMAMIERLIAAKVGYAVKLGDIMTVGAGRTMLDDTMIPFIVAKFEGMGLREVWGPGKVVIICDYLVPASQIDDIRVYKLSDKFAVKYGIPNLHRSDDICYQFMTEAGYVRPGGLVFRTGSHTTTYDCVGAFSVGIGYTEMVAVLGAGEIWLRVSKTIRIEINGELPVSVMSKDVILRIIGDLTAAGATYRALGFIGDTAEAISLSSRMVMANMGIKARVKCAFFVPDERTAEYLSVELMTAECALTGDADASCARVLWHCAGDSVPVMVLPSDVGHVAAIRGLKPVATDQVFFGSYTNGRLEDLMAAAEILKGKHIAPPAKLIVTPASRKIWEEAEANGILAIFSAAGVMIAHPSCGLRCGRTDGILLDGERVAATNNRSLLGRTGSSKIEIYLTSPKSATASALIGRFTEATC